jgi:hypothetical protein
MADVAIYAGDVAEQRHINGQYVSSTWLDGFEANRDYYHTKWTEDTQSHTLTQKKQEVNLQDREINKNVEPIKYRPWSDSILTDNLSNYYNNLFYNTNKTF